MSEHETEQTGQEQPAEPATEPQEGESGAQADDEQPEGGEQPQQDTSGLLPEYSVSDLPEGAEPDPLGRTLPQPVTEPSTHDV